MLNLERLRALHAIATHGSVNGAADALHVTTSAVSQQLAKLEREIGHQLLERNGRGVRLTEAAALLVTHTTRALSVLEQAEAELDAQRNRVVGRLTVAAFPTAARGLVPRALQALVTQHPQLRVALVEEEPRDAIPRLMRSDLDLVIATDWFNAPLALPDGISRAPLFDDLADVALPARHRLANAASIDLRDLAGEPWIAWPAGSICCDWLVHTLRSSGQDANIVHHVSEHATQLALVAAGLGAAIIPRLGRDHVPPTVRLIAVRPALSRHVYAMWRTDATRRTAIRATVKALHAAARREEAKSKDSRVRARKEARAFLESSNPRTRKPSARPVRPAGRAPKRRRA